MTEKPQRFKILSSSDPDVLAREVSAHMEGIEHVDEDGFKTTHLYALHGETRRIKHRVERCGAVPAQNIFLYQQNVFRFGVSAGADLVEVAKSASEAIQ